MQSPQKPDNERQRLHALQQTGILDTAPEERFDRVTRLARRLFAVPIALISLVDEERQWFKSCFGLEVTETARDISFCGHAILKDEVLVVADALNDERFADNPLVTGEAGIRFYAGYPIKLADGERIGALCIKDFEPRQLSQEDIAALSDLGRMVEDEFRAERAATVDELTGILNRRGFLQLAHSSLSFARRNQFSCVLAYLDLDEFKHINDRFGHTQGDQALKDFSTLITQKFRDSDVLARIGGDEFAVLMLDTDGVSAIGIIDRCCEALEEFNQQGGRDYQLQCSHGCVEIAANSDRDLDDWLGYADEQMYRDKRQS